MTRSDRRAGLIHSLIGDTRDSVTDPRRGVLWSIGSELDLVGLGSAMNYVKTYGQLFVYIPLLTHLTWAQGYRMGVVPGTDPLLLIEDRFFAGGGTSVRGFAESSLGPRAPDGVAIGGQASAIVNQELRFPLWKPLHAGVFYDAGNTFAVARAFDLRALRHSAGVGLRLMFPFGPVRVDWAHVPIRGRGRGARVHLPDRTRVLSAASAHGLNTGDLELHARPGNRTAEGLMASDANGVEARREAMSALLAAEDFRPSASHVGIELGARSHQGSVRSSNEDHYLIIGLGRHQDTVMTSLPRADLPARFDERGYALLVADGLGQTGAGAVASRVALSALAHLAIHFGQWRLRIDPIVAAEIKERAEWYSPGACRAHGSRADACGAGGHGHHGDRRLYRRQ